MNVRTPIDTEERFDSDFKKLHDTIFFASDKKIDLGKELKYEEYIDIRTKVEITFKNGKKRKLFLDRTGVIKYKNKYYKGSEELMVFFRKEENLW